MTMDVRQPGQPVGEASPALEAMLLLLSMEPGQVRGLFMEALQHLYAVERQPAETIALLNERLRELCVTMKAQIDIGAELERRLRKREEHGFVNSVLATARKEPAKARQMLAERHQQKKEDQKK